MKVHERNYNVLDPETIERYKDYNNDNAKLKAALERIDDFAKAHPEYQQKCTQMILSSKAAIDQSKALNDYVDKLEKSLQTDGNKS